MVASGIEVSTESAPKVRLDTVPWTPYRGPGFRESGCWSSLEREFSEENEQVAMKHEEPTSILYSPFVRNYSRFAAITVT
jgi:hypothetical protein